MSTSCIKYRKLVNETNRIIRLLSISFKDISLKDIHYILFHRNGVFAAIADKEMSVGELLIITRFLNLILTSNVLEISQLNNNDFTTVIFGLLNGINIHHNSYFWTTVFVGLSQQVIIEYICQSDQMLQILHNLLATKSVETMKLIRLTIITISHFIVKVLEYVVSNFRYINMNSVLLVCQITCNSFFYIIDETSCIGGLEMKSISQYLSDITQLMNLSNNKFDFIDNNVVLQLFKKLDTDNLLNNVSDCLDVIRTILPFMSQNLADNEVMQLVSKTCVDLLQRTVSADRTSAILHVAGDIIKFGNLATENFLDCEANVKALMGFIKVLPSSLKHSDTRNILWWHILCGMSSDLFKLNYKRYFLTFLENLLGNYLKSSTGGYGLSEFNLNRGYYHLSPLANHVFINILDCLNIDRVANTSIKKLTKELLMPAFLKSVKLKASSFNFSKEMRRDLKRNVLEAIQQWINILQRLIPQRSSVDSNDINANTTANNKVLSDAATSLNYQINCDYSCRPQSEPNFRPHLSVAALGDPVYPNIINKSRKRKRKQITEDIESEQEYVDRKDDCSYEAIPEIGGFHKITPNPSQGDYLKSYSSSNNAQDILKETFDIDEILPNQNSESSEEECKEINSNACDLSQLEEHENPYEQKSTSSLRTSERIRQLSHHQIKDKDSNSSESTDEATQSSVSTIKSNQNNCLLRWNPMTNTVKEKRTVHDKPNNRTRISSKLPKSHIDFTVNITSNINKSKSLPKRSKKVEFRIKFDMDPITKLCSKSLKLPDTNTANCTDKYSGRRKFK